MLKIINATPNIVTFNNEKESITYEKSGFLATVEVSERIGPEIMGMPTVSLIYGDVKGLPSVKSGVFYIVSEKVKASSMRSDLIAPNNAISNDKGQLLVTSWIY
jgi:hypothetical protein